MISSAQAETAPEPGKHDDGGLTTSGPEHYLQRVAHALFRAAQQANFRQTDRFFGWLLTFQMIAAFVVGLVVGQPPVRIDPTTMATLFINVLIVSLPVILAFVRPGEEGTRQSIAVAQMLTSAVFIHITHGRIETHFHVFASLVFLAFYRDWKVLTTASAVALCDHFLRGLLAPESLYGTETISHWRTVEHGAWIVLCNVCLARFCLQSVREMKVAAQQHARLKIADAVLHREAEERQKISEALAENQQCTQPAPLDAQALAEVGGSLTGIDAEGAARTQPARV